MLKIVLTTGGTGGHIFPAIALAEALRKRHPDCQLLFMGSEYGPESRIAPQNNIAFSGLPARGIMGRGLRAIPAAFGLGASVLKANSILKKFKPDAVAAFGGYASFGPALAASWRKIPLLLHEQNAIAGASNRFLGRLAQKICVSLPDARGFNKPCQVTGNPARAAINNLAGHARTSFPARLLVLGGSQGASALNNFMAKAVPRFRAANIDILHQTGSRDYQKMRQIYLQNGYGEDVVTPFIDDMAKAYQWASLALSRSGAGAVAELCLAGLPSVLTPFPAAIHDHQTRNAEVLTKGGGAMLMPETGLEPEASSRIIIDLLNDKTQLKKMSAKAAALATPHAASDLAKALESISR